MGTKAYRNYIILYISYYHVIYSMITKKSNSTRYIIIKSCFLLPLVLIPITATASEEQKPDILYDDHVMYNLNNLVQKGNHSRGDGDITHIFNTTLSEDGWYTSNITTIDSKESVSMSLKFKPHTDGTYSLVSTDANIDTRVASAAFTGASGIQDAPDLMVKNVMDRDDDPYALKDSIAQNCPWWSGKWSVESFPSKYIGKVHIKWNGKESFRYLCLFPYDLLYTKINYEGQERTNNSADENFDLGSPPYIVDVKWTYSSRE